MSKVELTRNLIDTGIVWIGAIPDNWSTTKIKYTTYVKGRIGWQGLRSDEFIEEGPYLVTGTDFENGYIKWNSCYHISEERYNEAPPIQLKENDLLITKDGTIGKVAIVRNMPYKAILNSGVFVTRSNIYEVKYMYWLLNSIVFDKYIKFNETGSTIKHLYQETFENFSYPIPDKTEQKKIISYLDKKVGKVEQLIKDKEKLIFLLEEKRQAIITEAVTKGLNPKVKMKDSGEEWIGEIPEHWEVKKLKTVADIYSSNVDKKSVEGEKEVLLCNYVDVYYNNEITNDINFMRATAKIEQIEKFTLKQQDVIITKDSESPTDIAIPTWVSNDLDGVLCGYHLSLIRSDKTMLNGQFLYYSLESETIREQFYSRANGVTRFGLPKEAIKNGIIACPPLDEQKEIAQNLYKLNQNIKMIKNEVQEQIQKLKEYRQSLIYEAVTGKIDVRDIEIYS